PDLSSLKVAQLQELATSRGIAGASKLRKGELLAAIEDSYNGGDDRSAGGDAASAASAPSTDAQSATFGAPTAEDRAPARRGSRRATSATVDLSIELPPGAPVVEAPPTSSEDARRIEDALNELQPRSSRPPRG